MSTLGQSVIVEPKPGAGERIAAQYLTTQPPDGYTLYLITGGANVISATDPQVTFSTLQGLLLHLDHHALSRSPCSSAANAPYKTLKDFIAAARERPGKLNYGHAGTGNTLHLAVELLKARTGIQIEPVAYKDQAQLISDVIVRPPRRLDQHLHQLPQRAQLRPGARAVRDLASSAGRSIPTSGPWPRTCRATKSCRGWALPPRRACRPKLRPGSPRR